MKQPEHVKVALHRALGRVRMKPNPCSPTPVNGKRQDAHHFAQADEGWLRCTRCGWYARDDR